MAAVYSNENFPLPVIEELRRLGHNVLTSLEAGNANRAIPDVEVLAFAAAEHRILITLNRRHFLQLHQRGEIAHTGILACSYDPDFIRQARQIHQSISTLGEFQNRFVRVNRPG